MALLCLGRVYVADVWCEFCVVVFAYYDSWTLCCGCICVVFVGSDAIVVVLYLVVLRGDLFGFGCWGVSCVLRWLLCAGCLSGLPYVDCDCFG